MISSFFGIPGTDVFFIFRSSRNNIQLMYYHDVFIFSYSRNESKDNPLSVHVGSGGGHSRVDKVTTITAINVAVTKQEYTRTVGLTTHFQSRHYLNRQIPQPIQQRTKQFLKHSLLYSLLSWK